MAAAVPLPENSVSPATRAQWRRWLERNHAGSRGIWVVTRRKDARAKALALEAVIEEALCFGWMEQRTRSLDDARRLAWIAPRPDARGWSGAHKELARKLLHAKRMAPAGAAAIMAAKRDGSWTVLDDIEGLVVPADLRAALAAHDSIAEFERLAPSARRHALEWIASAKRPATRATRVAETARLAKMGIVMTQWRINSRR